MILTATLGLCIAGLLAVLNSISQQTQKKLTVDDNFYEEVVRIESRSKALEALVAATLLERSPDRVVEKGQEILALIKELQDSFKLLNNDKYESIHQLQDQIAASDAGTKTVLEHLQVAETNLGEIAQNLSTISSDTNEIIKIRHDFEEGMTQLSKVFRKIPFWKLVSSPQATKSLSNLRRAVLVLGYSDSVRDLNFASRSKYSSAIKFFDPLIGTRDDYQKFKSIYEDTFSIAIKAAANTVDVQFSNFKILSSQYQSKVELLRTIIDRQHKLDGENQIDFLSKTTKISAIIVFFIVLIISIVGTTITKSLIRSVSHHLASTSASVGDLTAMSHQMNRISGNLKQSADRQTEFLHSALAANEESRSIMNITSNQIETSTSEVQNGISSASNITHLIQKLSKSIEEMKNSSEDLASLNKAMKSVEKNADVINGIVFKTQLLSVNASIEASKAGDSGKGFSVVAEEVAKLAINSGKASEDIQGIVDRASLQVMKTVEDIQTRVQNTVKLSGDCESALSELDNIFSNISNTFQALMQAVTEQNQMTSERFQAMDDFRSINSSTATISDEVLSFSNLLNSKSEDINHVTRELLTLIDPSYQVRDAPTEKDEDSAAEDHMQDVAA